MQLAAVDVGRASISNYKNMKTSTHERVDGRDTAFFMALVRRIWSSRDAPPFNFSHPWKVTCAEQGYLNDQAILIDVSVVPHVHGKDFCAITTHCGSPGKTRSVPYDV